MAILNFGSLNIDFTYDVESFVQAGQTISSTDLHVNAGGKGLNQSVALARAGAEVYHAGLIGTDGLFLTQLLENSGVHTQYVSVSEDVRTGNAIIQRDCHADNCIILYPGANRAITRQQVDEVLSHFGPGDWLLVQNETSELAYIVEKAYQQGLHVALNPSPADSKLDAVNMDYVSLFLLNEGEAAHLAHKADSATAQQCCDALSLRYPHATIVITLGSHGSLMHEPGKQTLFQPAYAVTAVDTTGAGDTFTGYLLAGLVAGDKPETILNHASQASAIAVTRFGAAQSIPTVREVETFDFSKLRRV